MASYHSQTDSDNENILYLDADDFSDTDDDLSDIHIAGNSSNRNGNTVSLTEDPEEDVDDVEIATLVASFRLSNGGSTSAPASSSSHAVVASTAGSATLVNESGMSSTRQSS